MEISSVKAPNSTAICGPDTLPERNRGGIWTGAAGLAGECIRLHKSPIPDEQAMNSSRFHRVLACKRAVSGNNQAHLKVKSRRRQSLASFYPVFTRALRRW